VAPPGSHRLLWRRFRPNLVSWLGMTPFLLFALFPFYWMVITSFKADANLYDLSRNPFWFSQVDGSGRPYHKDIIIPASYSEGPIRWTIATGAHTTASRTRSPSRGWATSPSTAPSMEP
jgi:ABC-type glycerol-3-phosphate transport system permease component